MATRVRTRAAFEPESRIPPAQRLPCDQCGTVRPAWMLSSLRLFNAGFKRTVQYKCPPAVSRLLCPTCLTSAL